jgi:Leucine-rich repeat (LRR) protein
LNILKQKELSKLVALLIVLPLFIFGLYHYINDLTTSDEEKDRQALEIEISNKLYTAKREQEEQERKELSNKKQGWENDILDGEYQFMPRAEKERYLNSNKWEVIRNAVIKRDRLCASCSESEDMHVHHVHYQRLGRENLNDLIVLCRICHFELHEKLGYSRQGLYAPVGFTRKTPCHDELVKPRYNEYWTPSGFKLKPEYKNDKPTVFWTEYSHKGSIYIGTSKRRILILKENIEKATSINFNNVDMSNGHDLEELDKLKNLKTLELKNCRLAILPEEIGELIHLELLDISENPLETLPDYLGNLTALKTLILPDRESIHNMTYVSEYLKGLPFLDEASKEKIAVLFT